MLGAQIILELYLPIYFYLIIVLFFLQTLVWLGLGSKQTNAIPLLTASRTIFFQSNVFIFIITLIGCPPTLGFFSKILIIHLVASVQNNLMLIIVLIVNVFLMVMYLQQLRLTQTIKKKTTTILRYNSNTKQTYAIILFQFINLFAI